MSARMSMCKREFPKNHTDGVDLWFKCWFHSEWRQRWTLIHTNSVSMWIISMHFYSFNLSMHVAHITSYRWLTKWWNHRSFQRPEFSMILFKRFIRAYLFLLVIPTSEIERFSAVLPVTWSVQTSHCVFTWHFLLSGVTLKSFAFIVKNGKPFYFYEWGVKFLIEAAIKPFRSFYLNFFRLHSVATFRVTLAFTYFNCRRFVYRIFFWHNEKVCRRPTPCQFMRWRHFWLQLCATRDEVQK